MAAVQTVSPLVRSPASENPSFISEIVPFPAFVEALPEASPAQVEDDFWSAAHGSQPPLSRSADEERMQDEFVPARLPHFGSGPG
jgi:hypothetical protein